MMDPKHILRIAALGAVLVAGSCSSLTNDDSGTVSDGAVNNPISVEPSYQSLKLSYSSADSGLAQADASRLEVFVTDYNQHGNGSIAVSAPDTPAARTMISYFADRIFEMGVPRNHILVATHDAANGDMRVEINFVSYRAHLDRKCGDWSENLAVTYDNLTPKNFGCSVQQNIAAQIADPRDLIAQRPTTSSDATRSAVVVDHYEKGEPSAAIKRTQDIAIEQSAPGSSVGQ